MYPAISIIQSPAGYDTAMIQNGKPNNFAKMPNNKALLIMPK
jgi:hypothetical protein